MLSPSPPWNLSFFVGFVPITTQNIRLSPTRRFPNFPHLSSYFLVPKNWGKLGNPHFSPIIPKSCIFQKKFLFSAFFRPLFEYQWAPVGIFCLFLSKRAKKVYGTVKYHEKSNDIWLNLGKTGDSQIIPKIIALVPTSNIRGFWEFVPKNPRKFRSPSPRIFPKDSRNPSPSLPCPKTLGTGKGIFEFRGPTWTP